jgi:20S proteasome alpha/beta subunit
LSYWFLVIVSESLLQIKFEGGLGMDTKLPMDEAMKLAVKILKQVMEEKMDEKNVDVATVTKEHGFRLVDKETIAAIIASL